MNTIDTSMYYTFSAIAQSLAGFLALSGVFVLYQIQRYAHNQSVLTNKFATEVSSKYRINDRFLDELKMQSEIGDFTKIADSVIRFSQSILIATLRDAVLMATNCAVNLKYIETKKKALKFLTKTSIIIGVIIIILCFLILANVPLIITSYKSYTFYLFFVGIGGAVVSIVFMLIGIIISLRK